MSHTCIALLMAFAPAISRRLGSLAGAIVDGGKTGSLRSPELPGLAGRVY